MDITIIIPKRYETFSKCMEAIIQKPERKIFQSELKRLVYPKSWHTLVKRELQLWNALVDEEYPGSCIIKTTQTRNPRTRRTNEILYHIPEHVEIISKPKHFLVKIEQGDTTCEEKQKPNTLSEP